MPEQGPSPSTVKLRDCMVRWHLQSFSTYLGEGDGGDGQGLDGGGDLVVCPVVE